MTTLREVYGVRSPGRLTYKAFADGGTDILLPTLGIGRERPASAPAERPGPCRPKSAGELQGLVLEALKEWTGRTGQEFDDDGDLQLARGDVQVLVHVDRKIPFADVFSTVLFGVEPGAQLLEALNERNNAARCVVLTLMGTRVVASVSVDAAVFVPELFTNALTADRGRRRRGPRTAPAALRRANRVRGRPRAPAHHHRIDRQLGGDTCQPRR